MKFSKLNIIIFILIIFSLSCSNSEYLGYGGSGDEMCKFYDIDYRDGKVDVSLEKDLNVKLINQHENFCGPASLAMVLDYYGISLSQFEIAKMMNIDENGAKPSDILNLSKELGFKKSSIVSGCDLGVLLNLVDNSYPVIVRTYDNSLENAHYMVVVGYDIKNKIIYLNDPAFNIVNKEDTYLGTREISFDDFNYLWNVNLLGKDLNSYNLMITVK